MLSTIDKVVPRPGGAMDEGDETYRLISIANSAAPSGSAGRDWFVYRIQQGANVITGYRRGNIEGVRTDVEKIVIGLNERRIVSKRKEEKRQRQFKPAPRRSSATPAAKAAAESQ